MFIHSFIHSETAIVNKVLYQYITNTMMTTTATIMNIINYIVRNLFLAEINWCHSETLPKSANVSNRETDISLKYAPTVYDIDK